MEMNDVLAIVENKGKRRGKKKAVAGKRRAAPKTNRRRAAPRSAAKRAKPRKRATGDGKKVFNRRIRKNSTMVIVNPMGKASSKIVDALLITLGVVAGEIGEGLFREHDFAAKISDKEKTQELIGLYGLPAVKIALGVAAGRFTRGQKSGMKRGIALTGYGFIADGIVDLISGILTGPLAGKIPGFRAVAIPATVTAPAPAGGYGGYVDALSGYSIPELEGYAETDGYAEMNGYSPIWT